MLALYGLHLFTIWSRTVRVYGSFILLLRISAESQPVKLKHLFNNIFFFFFQYMKKYRVRFCLLFTLFIIFSHHIIQFIHNMRGMRNKGRLLKLFNNSKKRSFLLCYSTIRDVSIELGGTNVCILIVNCAAALKSFSYKVIYSYCPIVYSFSLYILCMVHYIYSYMHE